MRGSIGNYPVLGTQVDPSRVSLIYSYSIEEHLSFVGRKTWGQRLSTLSRLPASKEGDTGKCAFQISLTLEIDLD